MAFPISIAHQSLKNFMNMAPNLLPKALNLFYSEEKSTDVTPIVAASISLVSIFLYRHWTSKKWSKGAIPPLPPGPLGIPLVGYLPFLGTSLHRSFTELAHVYGPIFKLRLGRKLCVVVSSPTLAKQILRDHDTTFANRDINMAAFTSTYGGHDVTFAPYGPTWRNLRKILVREMMSNPSLSASYALRKHEVRRTIKNIYSRVDEVMDVGETAFLTVLRVTTNSIWGGTLQGEDAVVIGAEFKAVITAMVGLLAKPNASDYFPVLARLDLQGVQKEMRRLLEKFEGILNPLIEDRKKLMEKGEIREELKNKGKKDFLQILLELKQREDVGASLTMNEMRALMMDTVAGATDTTTTMVEWVMSELLQHPHILSKVQDELSNVVGMSNTVEESHLPKLQYLDAVVKETFRLHPAVPLLIPRRPSAHCTVGGYTVPKGATVFLNAWAMHRDPEAWDSPSDFRPERFLSGNDTKWDYSGNNFLYLPFGSGRRMCPGISFGEKMLMYILASFLHSFEWKFPGGEELNLSEKFGIIMKKERPLLAIPTQRLPHLQLYE